MKISSNENKFVLPEVKVSSAVKKPTSSPYAFIRSTTTTSATTTTTTSRSSAADVPAPPKNKLPESTRTTPAPSKIVNGFIIGNINRNQADNNLPRKELSRERPKVQSEHTVYYTET